MKKGDVVYCLINNKMRKCVIKSIDDGVALVVVEKVFLFEIKVEKCVPIFEGVVSCERK